MNFLVRYGLLVMICLLSLKANAQIQSLNIGINGLTCSQCTRNVEMRLRRLSFVQDVQMDLEHTKGKITLKPGANFDPQIIAKAVKDAGFSVRFLKALFDFKAVQSLENSCFSSNGNSFQVIPQTPHSLLSNQSMQFIGEGFLPPAELKKWKPQLIGHCTAQNSKLYFVTLTNDAG